MKQKISKRLMDDEMKGAPIKPNYKDVGTCLRQKGDIQINRSKFKTAKDAQEQYDKLLSIGVVKTTYVVYKCPECHLWHFGLKEWAEK